MRANTHSIDAYGRGYKSWLAGMVAASRCAWLLFAAQWTMGLSGTGMMLNCICVFPKSCINTSIAQAY